jgi:hypothetical protein
MMRFVLPFSIAVIALLSCSRTPPDYGPVLDSLRTAVEPLMELRLHEGGDTAATDSRELQRTFATAQSISLLRDALEAERDTIQRQRLRYFLGFLGMTHVSSGLRPLSGTRRQVLSEAADSIAQALGFPSYAALVELAHDAPMEKTTALARTALSDTDSLAAVLIEGGQLPPGGGAPVFSSPPAIPEVRRFDKAFGSLRPEEMLVTTFAHAGLPLSFAGDSAFLLDCGSTIREMRLPVPKPSGIFLADAGRLYHLAGLCLHASYTREHAAEFRHLGDPAVPHAFAFLIEHLLSNQAWLRQRTSLSPLALKNLLNFLARQELVAARHDCAAWLDRGGVAETGPFDGNGVRLRARFLEALLDSVLTARFGVNWFEHPGALDLLKELWAMGTRTNAFSLARKLSEGDLTPGPWRSRLLNSLRFTSR